ncbi:MAG: hypothetical protein AB8B58_00950 [Roseobacter sp.]
MAKRVSTRKIKKHRLYTYDEAGYALGVTSHTVRSWRSSGLQVMASSKPHYILGEALIAFVDAKQAKRTLPPCLDKMLCFTCGVQKRPLGAMVDYVPITKTRGRLMGLCEDCEGPLHRFAGLSSLGKFEGIYDIAIKGAT